MDHADHSHRRAVVGDPSSSFWLYDSNTGFDLTHPGRPSSPTPTPNHIIQTRTVPITIHPPKSALVIVDMQNFFLSPCLGRPRDSNGLRAQDQLLRYAIPAARSAGVRIVWLNWGLTDDGIRVMPPATLRAFGFETVPDVDSNADRSQVVENGGDETGGEGVRPNVETVGREPRLYKGLGTDIGLVTMEDGTVVPGGRLLVRDTWNAELTPALKRCFDEDGAASQPPDVWIHKNRMSGLWGDKTPCTEFLDGEGIKTLFFAGVNTDQCVVGSLLDAFSKGYDVILLSDGAGTTSPASAQEGVEFNCAKTWGFVTTCREFADGLGLRGNHTGK